jgi:hypothetical protein
LKRRSEKNPFNLRLRTTILGINFPKKINGGPPPKRLIKRELPRPGPGTKKIRHQEKTV